MPNRIVLLRVFALAFAAEIVASVWLLLRSPADGPTLIYKGFPDYELGRIFYWLPLMVLAIIFLSLLEVRLHAHSEDEKGSEHSQAAHAFCRNAGLGLLCRGSHFSWVLAQLSF